MTIKIPTTAQMDTGNAVLPNASPLLMPEQTLTKGKLQQRHSLATSPIAIGWRRLYLLLTTAIMTAIATHLMWNVLYEKGISILEACFILLFIPLFAWIAFSFSSTLVGFFLVILKRAYKLGINPQQPLPVMSERTALLMPTYNESPERLMAGLQAIYESVAATGQLDLFDFFILSDTTKADVGLQEEKVFIQLCENVNGKGRIFYRRRANNEGRKAGNIADWVRRFGGAYPYMLILDADSLMSGETIVRLADGMHRNQEVALIQTLPIIVNGSTLFARMQQFSGRVYGPMMAYGLVWWQGAESNYWGHNAIIRTQAFAQQAGLPLLRGRRPFDGHILSHDFVEAALMRRGGWALHMLPYLQGSYEEGPPSLTDQMIRDRRWCQGNLQHSKVVFARGLHWVSRLHFLVGIGSYLTAPMWAMLLLVGMATPLYFLGMDLETFSISGFSTSGYWHQRDAMRAFWVLMFTIAILLAPKVLGYIALLCNPQQRRGCGGAWRAFRSIVLETFLSAVLAPIVMYIQSRGVAEVLAGKDSGWNVQRRDDATRSLASLISRYGALTLLGILMGAGAYLLSPVMAAWMSPVIFGMVLSIPLVALTSSRRLGLWLKGRGIFMTPEEQNPSTVLVRAKQLRETAA